MEVRHPVLFEHHGVGQIESERLQAKVRFLEFYFGPHPAIHLAIRYRAHATMLRVWRARFPRVPSACNQGSNPSRLRTLLNHSLRRLRQAPPARISITFTRKPPPHP